ncbi:ATP-binding protein [Aestuariicella hydrocarbonica]|uniref:ATP-binding protein n=1 Tax=Pseudomaricurvus hydrocarbonicus TaxID=1470433 RepID=A0A9E5MNW2_9GAMM|nr:ATP-binding protein [Aestuariicella hydrocarbonica]NHO67690.1 ATP-binding protein [Aestuariicella hydrocarbonica]
MATAEQIKALVKSFAQGDESRFYSIALQVAAKEDKKGHSRLAEELRRLVNENQKTSSMPANNLAPIRPLKASSENKELTGLLHLTKSDTRLSFMVLDAETKDGISRIIHEHRQRHALEKFGLTPKRKLLLSGPPGTGKTLTAKVLATELRLPLYTLQFDGLISRYLGETAQKLRAVFDFIRKNKAVYLFDEFDAIGGHRSNENDVGEIRRVLNSFLQFFEDEMSESLIICATNYSEALDSALFRRFDDIIKYHVPSASEQKEFVTNRMYMMKMCDLSWDRLYSAAEGMSYATLGQVCDDAAKYAVLYQDGVVTTDDFLKALIRRQ